MSRTAIISISAILLFAGCVAFVFWPRGHRSFVITDVSQRFSASVTSPMRPLGSGAMYVLVEGQLDGEAMLEVTSNRGRDWQEIPLSVPHVSFVTGGGEEWVDDLQVRYRPTTAKTGRLYVALYCGTGFTPDDQERYSRLSRNR